MLTKINIALAINFGENMIYSRVHVHLKVMW